MAVAYQTLNVTKRGYVSIAHPDTHYNVSPTSSYAIIRSPSDQLTRMLFGIEAMPVALRRKKLVDVQISAQVQQLEDRYRSPTLQVCTIGSDFDASTVTWNSMPRINTSDWFYGSGATAGTGFQTVTAKTKNDSSGGDDIDLGATILNRHAFAVFCSSSIFACDNLIPSLPGGSSAMVRVTYDPDVEITSKPKMKKLPISYFVPTNAAVFEWDLEATGGRCADEVFIQESAVFKYKKLTDESWTSISISGNTKTYTIPANTLPTASTIQWELTTIDEEGNEGTTSGSFATCTTTINVTSYPSGSNYDTRNTTLLEWTLRFQSTDYPQSSATFFWRQPNEPDWHEITVEGNVKQLVVPANTFPTAATVQWYMAATDTGEHTAQSSVRSFTTVSTSIEAVVFPDGNNVNPSIPILFEWKYNCYFGNYDQSTATFQWRKSDEPDWNDIIVSGNVKSLQVPADTFATSAEIQWRIIGTDSGGHVSQTNVLTFTTLSTQITQQGGPTDGYSDPREPITFSWYYPCAVGDYSQQSAVFHWKVSTDAEWTDITISGNTKSLTIEPNTFPVASFIQWYIEGTDTGGTTTETDVFEFSTTAETAYAYCVAPVGRVVDGTKPITFSWIVVNADGSNPTRTKLLWKYDIEASTEWKTILDTSDNIQEYTVPEETFEAGSIDWKISAYNRDGIEGPENQASFVCLIAPDAPVGLSATPVPRTLVRWQASGQEAYEVSIDGKIVKKEYAPGTYSYQQMEPLEDGIHTITVRVQGAYGLWSNPTSTTIQVINDPDVTIELSGAFGIDGTLSWEASDTVTDAAYQVYRDGIRIADVGDAISFTDRFVLGEHTYFVELWQADGNYARSNTVTGTMSTETTALAEISGGEWLYLRLTETSNSSQSFTWSKAHAIQHVLGSPYPILDLGISEDLTGSYECAFRTEAEAKRFEEMTGKPIILKSRAGNAVTGAITAFSKRVKTFYIAYSFSLQKITWKELGP